MESAPDISQGEGLIRTYELFEHLIEDVYKSFEILEPEKESQYLRRVTVRNVFSFIEGIIQILKFEIRSDLRLKYYSADLSPKEKEILYEEKEKNGSKYCIFIPIDQNVKKTFKLAAKVWNLTEYSINTESHEYQWFINTKETRNRLTHPRTYYDINITDKEMAYLAQSFEWVRSEFFSIMKEKVESINQGLPKEVVERFKNA